MFVTLFFGFLDITTGNLDYVNAGHGAGRAGNEAEFHDMWKRIIDWYQTHFDKADEKDKKGEKDKE